MFWRSNFIMIHFGSPKRDYSLSRGYITLEKGLRSQHGKDVQLHDSLGSPTSSKRTSTMEDRQSVTPKRRPCRLQTADCRPCRLCRLCRPCRLSPFFLILAFAFTFDSHIFSLWSQISVVQLYFGVFVYEKAVLRDANLVCDC